MLRPGGRGMRDGFKVVRFHDSVMAMNSVEEEPVGDK